MIILIPVNWISNSGNTDHWILDPSRFFLALHFMEFCALRVSALGGYITSVVSQKVLDISI